METGTRVRHLASNNLYTVLKVKSGYVFCIEYEIQDREKEDIEKLFSQEELAEFSLKSECFKEYELEKI